MEGEEGWKGRRERGGDIWRVAQHNARGPRMVLKLLPAVRRKRERRGGGGVGGVGDIWRVAQHNARGPRMGIEIATSSGTEECICGWYVVVLKQGIMDLPS